MTSHLRLLLGILLLLPLAIWGCRQPPTSPNGGIPPSTDSLPENADDFPRASFTPLTLPQEGRVGDEPAAIARSLYGTADTGPTTQPQQILEQLSASPEQVILLLTQTNLPDDSVRGIRYRLEFEPVGEQWQLVWVGRQTRCQPGRGHQDWQPALCV